MKPKRGQNDVCAVLVTFRPGDTVEQNIVAIRPQVEDLVIVDNGSPRRSILWLKKVCAEQHARLIENGNNIGLPAALNVGIDWAIKSGFSWVMLLDQDSTATDGMVEAMLGAYNKSSDRTKTGIVAPRYINRLSKNIDPHSPPLVGERELDAAWTSGSLIPIDVLTEVGGFEPCLFIDLLDYEFSLRVRDAGYSILLADSASLLHEAGFPETHRFLGMFAMTTSNHSPARRYYCARNRVWIVKKYRTRFRWLFLLECARQTKELVRLLVCERDRWRKLISVARGIKDGLIGRMGNTVQL
jgi:rhamnosyltransferase